MVKTIKSMCISHYKKLAEDSPGHTHGNLPPAPPGLLLNRLRFTIRAEKVHENSETSVKRQTLQKWVWSVCLCSPVTVVPQGEPSMAPWLWACRSIHGCWPLLANSTVTVNFPRSLPPSDKVTRESANTHFCSSAGSETKENVGKQSIGRGST